MSNEKSESTKQKEENNDAAVKPDPETLNTTDPQEHMEGPISSLMQEAGESFEKEKSKDELEGKKNNK